MAILFTSSRAFADDDVDFLGCASAHEFQHKRLADGSAVELRVNIFKARDGMAGEGYENVSDDDAGFIRGAFGLDLKDDSGGFFGALQGLAESVWQTNRLQSDAEITLRDVTLLQQGVNDMIDGRSGNGDRSKARETRGGNPDGTTLSIYDGATDGGGLQADVKADVGSKCCAGPGAAF
jgi:hypothetical protein